MHSLFLECLDQKEFVMKNFRLANYLFFALTIGLGVFASCKQVQKPVSESAEEFKNGLTATDTSDVVKLCDDCMNTLKAGEIDKALEMIQMVDTNMNVTPLDEASIKKLRKTFKFFPVVNYRLDKIAFNTSGLNDVKYIIEFTEAVEPGSAPSTIGFMFNPVKVDGKWVLTVKQASQEVVSK